MKHLRTHVLMLSVGAATVVAVTLAARHASAPDDGAAHLQAAQFEIEAAPVPALRPPIETHHVAIRPGPDTVREESAAAREHVEALAERAAPTAPSSTSSVAPAAVPASGSVWDRLAQCESGGNWAHSGGRYEGGLQFHPATWDAHKPSGYPEAAYQASRAEQIVVGERVLASQGWGAWPACSRKLGLR